jgi:predicted outer membrane lipoprotein
MGNWILDWILGVELSSAATVRTGPPRDIPIRASRPPRPKKNTADTFLAFFMVLPFFSPLLYFSWIAGREQAKNPSGENVLRLIQDPFSNTEFGRNPDSCL